MKLVRFVSKVGAEFGIIRGGTVFRLHGDPMSEHTVGMAMGLLDELELLAPCCPSKIVAMAINFEGIDGYSEEMEEPLVFIKPATCVCGPGSVISNPFPGFPMWGEAELAVVIGKIPANCSEADAERGVFGFTIANDLTVDNVAGRDHHLARSKCPDNFCPIGPWIDTEFDSSDCLIEAVQNGEVIRAGRTREQIWKWPKIIAWLSTWMTLKPWDLVITGNPPDIGGLRLLSSGDIYTSRIEGLGKLTITIN